MEWICNLIFMALDNSPNILHVSTYSSGGAFNAAYRLYQSQLKAGYNARFITLYKNGAAIDTENFLETISLFDRIISSVRFRLLTKKNRASFPPYFNPPQSAFDLNRSQLYKWADIIHLHWVSRFLDFESFFRKNKKPIVWTFHDEYPLKGGLHYDYYRQYLNEELNQLETRFSKLKEDCIQKSPSKIFVACPSLWLTTEASNSDIFYGREKYHIGYGIDTDIFYPIDKTIARSYLAIPDDRPVLLFIAESFKDPRKGSSVLATIIKHGSFQDFHLVVVGEKNDLMELPENSTYLGYITNTARLIYAYSSADLFVCTSLADNLPNTVMESMSCGTPVVAFNIGGIPDLVQNGSTGMVIDRQSIEQLVDSVATLANSKSQLAQFSIASRRHILEKYSLEVQLARYVGLYNHVINNERSCKK